MPRPHKWRKVCSLPSCTDFIPQNKCCEETILMTLDEYETIRLIDLEGLTQEQCAEKLEVARTTIQSIYANARKKLAQCIVLGHHLKINGGNVQLCDHKDKPCGHSCCRRMEHKNNF
ncbi:DUF134 domain-containing protein [Selenomonadales bacterium OttesenSCG-928-I06]|nr:DUF134 domain-containing protein [Selenomonadales bacterium OttesenSCG-928-I06]